jgi:serine/threonine-protein kinase RsbW
MASSHDDRILKRSLPSSLGSYQELIATIVAQLGEYGWASCDQFAVEMALEESISNAIRHGNKEDPAKRVEVEFRYGPNRFWACICDEGSGFEPSAVPDCCAPDRLEVPGGRGLALIRAYMTHVEYNARGNCVTMEKRLSN